MQLKIGFGVPAYGGQISVAHARMWLELGAALADNRERFTVTMPLATVDVCQVDKARTMLIDLAIQAQCDWLVMLDADTYVEDGVQLLQMVSTAAQDGQAVVVGAVPRRSTDGVHELMVYRTVKALVGAGTITTALSARDLGISPRALVPVDEAATACMAINIPWVVERLGADLPWFRFAAASEDRDFCQRVRVAGGRISCDRRVQTRHVNKPSVLRWEGV